MKATKVTLLPLEAEDREQFIRDNQWAFKYGAMIEFGERDDHFEEDGEIISRETIEESIDAENSEAYRIMYEGRRVGGVVLTIDKETRHKTLICSSSIRKNTARGLATPLGARSRPCTPRPRYGRPAHHILKSGIYIFTLINAAFISWNFTTNIIPIHICRTMSTAAPGLKRCSDLRR